MATAQQTLDIARAEIGYKESPAGSNKQKYTPRAEPWCVDFVNWCCARAGVSLPGQPTASVYTLLAAFRAAGRLHATPQPGDVGFWSYGDGHAEFVDTVPLDGRSVVDIGGNTSSGDGSPDNGGEVARKRRSLASQCLGFGRPAYSITPDPPASATQEDDMSAELTITWPDGSKTVGLPTGEIDSWPTERNPSFGSFFSLNPDERKVINWPMKAGDGQFRALCPVDMNNKGAGYIGCVVGNDGKAHQFGFTPVWAAAHGL